MSNWTEQDVLDWQRRHEAPGSVADVAAKGADTRPEYEIQAECVKLMEEDGWRPLRTDPVSDKSRGKGFGELGMADYLFMRPISPRQRDDRPPGSLLASGHTLGEVLWIEWKARNGKLSMIQNTWHRNERAKGFTTWIASVDFPASVAGFRAHYIASGLARNAQWCQMERGRR